LNTVYVRDTATADRKDQGFHPPICVCILGYYIKKRVVHKTNMTPS